MSSSRNIFTIGETVYDIIFRNDQPVAARPGGSMLNTSVSLGRLGIPVVFISEIGKDRVGKSIINFLKANDVGADYIFKYEDGKTALSLAYLDKNEDADYTFYKLYPEKRLKLEFPIVKNNDIVLFGSSFAISVEVRKPLMSFIKMAIRNKAIIIYDPNFRRSHLKELLLVKDYILENISTATIVRGSHEDFKLIFNTGNADDTYNLIRSRGCKNLIYTSGKNRVELRTEKLKLALSVPNIKAFSTIGAGDNFNAGIIYGLYRNQINLSDLNEMETFLWSRIIETAISFGTHVCQSYDNYVSEDFIRGLK